MVPNHLLCSVVVGTVADVGVGADWSANSRVICTSVTRIGVVGVAAWYVIADGSTDMTSPCRLGHRAYTLRTGKASSNASLQGLRSVVLGAVAVSECAPTGLRKPYRQQMSSSIACCPAADRELCECDCAPRLAVALAGLALTRRREPATHRRTRLCVALCARVQGRLPQSGDACGASDTMAFSSARRTLRI